VEALDGVVVLNGVANNFAPLNGVWISGSTLSFQATGTSTTLRFTDQTNVDNAGINWGLDMVSVGLGRDAEAPEPATFALVGLGLAGAIFARRRTASRGASRQNA